MHLSGIYTEKYCEGHALDLEEVPHGEHDDAIVHATMLLFIHVLFRYGCAYSSISRSSGSTSTLPSHLGPRLITAYDASTMSIKHSVCLVFSRPPEQGERMD